jgi:biopolymer transport protein ExbD
MRTVSLLILTMFVVSCSAPRPAPKREDAVMSGQETAEKAGASARKAEKEDRTGIIVASSDDDAEPTTQPTEPPPAEPTELSIEFVKGTATMNGEPIADVAKVLADAAKRGDVALMISADDETPYARVVELMDQANTAGIDRVALRATEPEADSTEGTEPKP